MLGNCEKMVLISSTTNEWTQIDDPKGSSFNNNMASVAAAAAAATIGTDRMDQKVAVIAQDQHLQQQQQQQQKQQQHQQQQLQQQQNQEALRCPRCDSTNTKFCYYNNYSLTQPRHFCKACKRYWTRGGTLRNVPVGGGCRKNKRVKRPPNNINSCSSNTSITNNNSCLEASVNSASSAAAAAGGGGGGAGTGLSSLSSGGPQIHDLISSGSNHHHQSLLYGLTNNSDINFPFSRYDLQNPPQMNGVGLGFSSGLVHNMNSMNIHQTQNTKQIFQDLISSNPLFSNYNNTSTSTTSTTTPSTISSLLASSLHQMKGANYNNNFQTLLPSYEDDLNMKGNGQNGHNGSGTFTKEVKMEFERQQNRSIDHHNQWSHTHTHNMIDHHSQPSMASPSSDQSNIMWGNAGAWLSPSDNHGSSVPSLI